MMETPRSGAGRQKLEGRNGTTPCASLRHASGGQVLYSPSDQSSHGRGGGSGTLTFGAMPAPEPEYSGRFLSEEHYRAAADNFSQYQPELWLPTLKVTLTPFMLYPLVVITAIVGFITYSIEHHLEFLRAVSFSTDAHMVMGGASAGRISVASLRWGARGMLIACHTDHVMWWSRSVLIT
jgi:hypothetical protein